MSDPNLVVGLTGGIASGKSAAADEFARLGVSVVDTDLLAREVVAIGSPGLAEIVAHFGAAILDTNGQLDRRQLRTRVFADPAERRVLESITHPRIRELARQRVQQSVSDYTIVVIPLLAENARYPFIDRVLVIDVDPQVQLQRLQSRDALERQLAEAMIAAQATREQRLAIADDVIDNSSDLPTLYAQVAQQHARYLELAFKRSR